MFVKCNMYSQRATKASCVTPAILAIQVMHVTFQYLTVSCIPVIGHA